MSGRVGTSVTVKLDDGTEVAGQVWAPAERDGYVWLALESGRFVAANRRSGVVYEQVPGVERERVGKVAA